MKIAITGANGFLGSHLVNSCLACGHETIALVRSGANLSRLQEDKRLIIRTINYQSSQELKNSIRKLKNEFDSFECIIHNAGLTVSTDSNEYYRVNVGLTELLLKETSSFGLLHKQGNWIQISSYAAHGPENHNLPVSSYGKSKRDAESIVEKSGYDYQIYRPTGIYGSGDLAFLPLFQTAKFGIYPLLAPIDQKISMIHGYDVAFNIVKNIQGFKKQRIIHLSDGKIYSHQDFKRAIEQAMNKKLKMISIPNHLVGGWLRLSDFISKKTKMHPGVTLEKFHEISQNWNLKENKDLFHPELDCRYDLFSGFKEAYQYYKSVNLL